MNNDNFKESLVEQQALYGVKPIKVDMNEIKDAPIQALYGVPSPIEERKFDVNDLVDADLYGPPSYFENRTIEKNNNKNDSNYANIKTAVNITGVAFSIIVFIIGLIAMFSKKISKTTKLILVLSLALVLVAIALIVVVSNIVL